MQMINEQTIKFLDSGKIRNYNLINCIWAWGKWNIQLYCIKISYIDYWVFLFLLLNFMP